MPPFLNFYLAEKRGNLEQLINVFSAQRRYLERYIPSISAMTIDDNFESAHWICHSVFAGAETAHFFPFRSNLMRGYKLADITDVQDFRERFDRWPIIVGMKRGGFSASQWVVGRYPRRPGMLSEEAEWGQLGVLQDRDLAPGAHRDKGGRVHGGRS